MIAEIFDISILAIIFSPKYIQSYWNAGLLSAISDNVGRILGNSLITVAGAEGLYNIPTNFFLWNAIGFSIIFILLLVIYKDLKKSVELTLIKFI